MMKNIIISKPFLWLFLLATILLSLLNSNRITEYSSWSSRVLSSGEELTLRQRQAISRAVLSAIRSPDNEVDPELLEKAVEMGIEREKILKAAIMAIERSGKRKKKVTNKKPLVPDPRSVAPKLNVDTSVNASSDKPPQPPQAETTKSSQQQQSASTQASQDIVSAMPSGLEQIQQAAGISQSKNKGFFPVGESSGGLSQIQKAAGISPTMQTDQKPVEVESQSAVEVASVMDENPAEVTSATTKNSGEAVSVTDGNSAEIVSVTEEKPAEVVSVTEEKPAEVVSVTEEKPAEVVSVTEEKPAEVASVTEEKPAEVASETIVVATSQTNQGSSRSSYGGGSYSKQEIQMSHSSYSPEQVHMANGASTTKDNKVQKSSSSYSTGGSYSKAQINMARSSYSSEQIHMAQGDSVSINENKEQPALAEGGESVVANNNNDQSSSVKVGETVVVNKNKEQVTSSTAAEDNLLNAMINENQESNGASKGGGKSVNVATSTSEGGGSSAIDGVTMPWDTATPPQQQATPPQQQQVESKTNFDTKSETLKILLPKKKVDDNPAPKKRLFLRYNSSDWELMWLEKIELWTKQRSICRNIKEEQIDYLRDFLELFCNSHLDSQEHKNWCVINDTDTQLWYNKENSTDLDISWSRPEHIPPEIPLTEPKEVVPEMGKYDHILSKMTFIDEEAGEEYSEYIEPLISHLRFPLSKCLREEDEQFDTFFRGFLLPPPPVIRGDRAIFFNAGADGMEADWNEGPKYFLETWERHGIKFDDIFNFDENTTPDHFFETVPFQFRKFVHFEQCTLASSPEENFPKHPFLPEVILEGTHENDYIMFKLDIDRPLIESNIINYILREDYPSNAINELFWENHISQNYLMEDDWLPSNTPYMTFIQSYEFFLNLRKKGIRAHSWV